MWHIRRSSVQLPSPHRISQSSQRTWIPISFLRKSALSMMLSPGPRFLMNLLGTNNSAETEHYVLSSLLDKDFCGNHPGAQQIDSAEDPAGIIPAAEGETFPIVLIDCNYSDISLPRIALDDREGRVSCHKTFCLNTDTVILCI